MIHKILITLLMLTCLSCGENDKDSDSLIVGTAADNPPYEYIDKNNEVVGLDIDIMQLVAKALNKKLVIKNMEFYSLLPSLDNKQLDVVIAGVSPTESRKKHFDFSNTYFTSQIVFIALKDNNIKTLEDLRGKTVAVQTGTIFENLANDGAFKDYDINILSLSNFLIAVEELKKGSVQSIMTEEVQAKNLAAVSPELEVKLLPNFESSDYAIIMPKDSKYKDQINIIIDNLMVEGKINEIKEKWLK